MKWLVGKQFNVLFFLVWFIICAVIWGVSDYHPNDLFSKIVFLGMPLGVLIATTFVLCHYFLPKTMVRNRGYIFVIILVNLSLLQAVLLYCCDELLFLLGNRGIIAQIPEGTPDKFSISVASFVPVALLLNLGFGGLRFLYAHSKLSEQHSHLQRDLIESQLVGLQAQINPHFTFNILNHIHILMQTDKERASMLLLRYADVLRYQLYEGNKERIDLHVEIAFLKDYVAIECIRWDNRLTVDCFWQIVNPQGDIAPHLFFILLENSFKHVFKPSTELGKVEVRLWQEAEDIYFYTKNSRSGKNRADRHEQQSGLGLINLRKRLNLIYPDRFLLEIKETETDYSALLVIYR